MVQIGRRRGATGMTVPLMLGAFVVLIGFFVWLAISAEPTAPPEILEDEAVEVSAVDALAVDPSEFGAGPGGYESLTVRLDGVAVSQMVGNNAFFIDLPQSPFLVHAGPEVVAAGMPAVNASATVIGRVAVMTPAIIAGWEQAGEFTAEERPLVEFATHYIEAVEIHSADGGTGDAGSSDASGNGA